MPAPTRSIPVSLKYVDIFTSLQHCPLKNREDEYHGEECSKNDSFKSILVKVMQLAV